jgi:hypothetical protein
MFGKGGLRKQSIYLKSNTHQENYTLLSQLSQMYCSLTRDPLGIFHIFFV